MDKVVKHEKKRDFLVSAEGYRKEIIEMVDKIENQEYLFKIYHYILAKYRREQKEEETED